MVNGEGMVQERRVALVLLRKLMFAKSMISLLRDCCVCKIYGEVAVRAELAVCDQGVC